MPDIQLTALADAGAFVSQEHQEHLAEAFSMRSLQVDPATASVSFADAAGESTTWRAHFVGSASPEDDTWLWGWQNVNRFPDAFVHQSRRIRTFGDKHGLAEFSSAQLPLSDELPVRLVRAVKALTGFTAHVVAPTGAGGTRAWLLVDDPAVQLPPPTVARTVGVVMSGLAGGGVTDHRRALVAWAEQRDAVVEDGGSGAVRVHVSDGSVRVRFEGDRIVGISTGRGGEQQPDAADGAPEEAARSVAAAPAPRDGAADLEPIEDRPEPVSARRGWLSRVLGRA